MTLQEIFVQKVQKIKNKKEKKKQFVKIVKLWKTGWFWVWTKCMGLDTSKLVKLRKFIFESGKLISIIFCILGHVQNAENNDHTLFSAPWTRPRMQKIMNIHFPACKIENERWTCWVSRRCALPNLHLQDLKLISQAIISFIWCEEKNKN